MKKPGCISVLLVVCGILVFLVKGLSAQGLRPEGENMIFGFSTSEWGAAWDTETLVDNLTQAELTAVELQSGHAHKIAPAMSPQMRTNIRDSFVDANMTVIGTSLSAKLDKADQGDLMTEVDNIKQQIKLSHDIGGSGVCLKGGIFSGPDEEIKEEIVKKAAETLKALGDFAVGFGQELRVEVVIGKPYGATAKVLKEVAADNVKATLVLDEQTVSPEVTEQTFQAFSDLLAQTMAISSSKGPSPATDKMASMLVAVDFSGWVVLHGKPDEEVIDVVQALVQQRGVWSRSVFAARKK